jgi:Tfp pilus assembly protein PilF
VSLLLQALQKASKNRDDAAAGETTPAPDPLDSDELVLEPMGRVERVTEDHDTSPAHDAAIAASASPAQAQTMMQASRAPGFNPVDYAREHYMIVFLGIAVLFAIGYGAYVYVQVSNPSWLRKSSPRPVASPLAAASAPAPAPAAAEPAAAKISGIPASMQTPAAQTTAAPQQSAAAPTQSAPAAPVLAPVDGTHPASANVAAAEPASSPARLVKTPVAAEPRPVQRAAVARATEEPMVREVDEDGIETVVLKPARARNAAPAAERASATPVAPSSELMEGYNALQAGDSARARTLYEQVLAADARSVDALLGLGAIAWKEGRVEEAMQHYQRVLELEPRNAYAQAGLIAMVGSADPAASETRLRQLLSREPSGFLYFTLGNLYADQGLWPAAQQAYFQAYQSQPENPDYAFNLAVGLEHVGQTKPALDYYRKALDLSFRKGRANFDQSLVIERVGQLSTRVEQ